MPRRPGGGRHLASGGHDGTVALWRATAAARVKALPRPDTGRRRGRRRLRAAATDFGGQLAVRTTDCLGPCEQANVIVVRPSAAGRRNGGRAMWIGWAKDDDCTDDILSWVAAGGPGLAEPPATLELQFIRPPGEARTRARRRGRARR
ncbi:(2Fe-2S) ferredoxin domain-containing protein [Streptomyces sp. NPDC007917]|uniref:(2Fe-2S) ferredoxin domain-containing protein n=1 Tax=Streptomyces sp. NPDC007917 TaxID=3364793 RepID=UPI0036EBE911